MTGGRAPLVVVGDALLDRNLDGHAERLCPDAPVPVVDDPVATARPGGAGLAACLAAADGREVTLVTALADDGPGRELAGLLAGAGVAVVDLGLSGATPEKVRVRAGGRSIVRLDHGGQPGPIGWGPGTAAAAAAARALGEAPVVLVSDYGRGVAASPEIRRLLAERSHRGMVWDPHPRGPAPVAGAVLVTPNRGEAQTMAGPLGVSGGAAPGSLRHVVAAGRALAARWQAANVVVTIGDRGAVLVTSGGPPLVVPAVPVPHGDPCGAGDRFAATAAGLLGDGALPSEAVEGAVAAASAFVAAGGADGRPEPPRGPTVYGEGDALSQLLARVRGGGGTVVATGGCFDLLHAGHVGLLDGARALGDCLVVCLNSDASVRRLKGPGRPLVPAAERSVVLGAMTAVDAVVTFEEDTPEALLDRLRPDVFVKGADYAVADLPEAPLLARWGGQAVVLPYAPGWSTTRLLKEASRAH